MAGRYILISTIDWSQDSGTTASEPNVIIPRPQLASPGGEFEITLAAAQEIGLVHVQRVLGSGGVNVAFGGYAAAAPGNLFTTDAEWQAFGASYFFVPPAPVSAQGISVNVAGGVCGYIGVCSVWEPAVNMSYGWSISVIDLSDVQRTPFGSTYVTRRGVTRRINVGIDFLRQPGIYGEGDTDEIFDGGFTAGVIGGQGNMPMAVVPFPDADMATITRTSVAGYGSSQQSFSNPFFATWQASFQVDQLI